MSARLVENLIIIGVVAILTGFAALVGLVTLSTLDPPQWTFHVLATTGLTALPIGVLLAVIGLIRSE